MLTTVLMAVPPDHPNGDGVATLQVLGVAVSWSWGVLTKSNYVAIVSEAFYARRGAAHSAIVTAIISS